MLIKISHWCLLHPQTYQKEQTKGLNAHQYTSHTSSLILTPKQQAAQSKTKANSLSPTQSEQANRFQLTVMTERLALKPRLKMSKPCGFPIAGKHLTTSKELCCHKLHAGTWRRHLHSNSPIWVKIKGRVSRTEWDIDWPFDDTLVAFFGLCRFLVWVLRYICRVGISQHGAGQERQLPHGEYLCTFCVNLVNLTWGILV